MYIPNRKLELIDITQFFLFLITIGPWFLFLAYDLILYLFRTVAYEIPVVGGRAAGKERPRAPSLKERPSGDPRVIGIGVPAAGYVEQEDVEEEEKLMNQRATPEYEEVDQQPVQHKKPQSQVADTGFSFGGQEDEEEESGEQPQRVFSIGGNDERTSWTEENARRRMGFKDDDGPG
jgi:hypothetical protein